MPEIVGWRIIPIGGRQYLRCLISGASPVDHPLTPTQVLGLIQDGATVLRSSNGYTDATALDTNGAVGE